MTQIAPIALTIGEPGGIGPELAVKAWLRRNQDDVAPFCLITPAGMVKHAIAQSGTEVPVSVIKTIGEAASIFKDALPVLEITDGTAEVISGTASAKTAGVVIESITKAVELATNGEASAVVTNPIQKSALYEAGFSHPGHTEFLAELAGPGTIPVMMLANSKLRVVPLTIHIALKDVPGRLTTKLIVERCRITHQSLQNAFGIAAPRLAIAGLNPHAGEDGAMGTEEQTIMRPAIEQLRREGIDVIGPLPADTMFHDEARANYDVALCPYHDQALIPVKTLDFHGGVNVTLGLPFIRTSPDHGTALNIAGKGVARPDSLIAALKMAEDMATKRLATGA
ncbi:4-hydroxythreonine-4-phosphate dehydrogenase PdxA [Thalassospira sp. HF15]|uniref:4-hydroxythreonine-4-phosphate dehydrogenase PdxA n=1 Tax=Thalassospira sp. HF15 TaxID=2722755 RepID=UPI0014300A3B|nr:4-hydroxythreonine-4-phosphate dehydrogenase PdxA [Thalassospira sp. HF15]NIY77217.1 4-hydroxythreonine-4-phosphate dehydrogenase PdxA [Thalassospira sp. HF15]